MDFHEEAARLRREALAGRVVVERLRTLDEEGDRFKVPKGSIQHWLGVILVPNAELNDVLDGLQYDIPPHELQEETILESRVLARDGDRFDLYTKVQLDAPMASAQFNIEQAVEYVRPGGDRAWSRIEATRGATLRHGRHAAGGREASRHGLLAFKARAFLELRAVPVVEAQGTGSWW